MKFNHPKLKGYRYLETLGEGGQGMVVKVKDPSGRRVYALKLLKPSENTLAEREIKALEQLNHSNIVQIYDWSLNTNEGNPFILMQYMKHGNIQEYIHKNSLGIEEKLRLIQDATCALEYVHQKGMIHRDIKPQNIFINDEGEGAYACLGDFGIVKELGATTLAKTAGGCGSMYYSSPEVFNTEKASFQSDIYALGMTLYEVITGKHAYDISNPMTFFQEMGKKEIEKPSSYDYLVNEILDELCIKSIEKKKEKRFDNIEKFAMELGICIEMYSKQQDYKRKVNKSASYINNAEKSAEQDDEKEIEYYEKAAEEGDSNALKSLGDIYAKYGDLLNYERAKEYYERAAEKGNSDALKSLGDIYKEAKAGIWDYEKAREYYERAVEKGNNDALNSLGDMYIRGKLELKVRYEKAREYYERAVQKGDLQISRLGFLHATGLGGKRDLKKAKKYYAEIGIAEDGEIYYELGSEYFNGKIVEFNFEKGLEYYKKAGEEGNSDALNSLGDMCLEGIIVKRNYRKAREFYGRAGESSNVQTSRLAFLCATGLGGKVDYKKAKKYYNEIGIVGDEGIYYELGKKYFEGNIVKKDYKKAIKCYERAGEKGSADALCKLGDLCCYSSIVEQDYEQARKYYQRAADKGSVEATNELGRLYEHGYGVEKDQKKAQEYYKKAREIEKLQKKSTQ